MNIEQYISNKIYDQLLPNQSVMLNFMQKDCAGVDTGNRPTPGAITEPGVFQFDPFPSIHYIDSAGENYYKDINGVIPYNSNSFQQMAWLQNKHMYINHSYEPIHYDADDYFWNNTVFDWKDRFPGPADSYGSMFCNPEQGDRLFLLHSERNSYDLDLIGFNITTQNILPVYWFANGYVCATEWYKKFGLKVWDDFEARPIHHKFICAARLFSANKSYRLDLLNKLELRDSIYSLLERCPYTDQTPNDVLSTNTVQPNSFDSHSNESAYIEMRHQTAFNTSFLHVVMESIYTEKKHYLTEKTFKPIVLQQPFVLVGSCGTLGYLKSYGFKTFDNWWDESYDEIRDPEERLEAIADVVNYVAGLDWQQLYAMRTQMTEVLQHNRKLFYGRFAADCWHELQQNIRHYL